MFVTLKRHRELENHYDRLADYAARINLENGRLEAENRLHRENMARLMVQVDATLGRTEG